MKASRLLSVYAVIALLATMSALQTGCLVVAAGAAGAGAVAYVRGELQSTLSHSFEATERAANAALEQLQLIKINEKKDAFVAIITARTADDKKVEIKLTQLSAQTTKTEIRVGVFGDEARSLSILEKIKANL